MKRTAIAIIAAAALATPALAVSANYDFEISIDRANMQTLEGAKIAYETLSDGIEQRCQDENKGMGVISVRLTKACTKRTLAKVVKTIDEPMLTEAHVKATGSAS